MLTIHTDCRFYKTDRPCEPHKRAGYLCATCPVYEPLAKRVLVVKLDATGDVLRTTSLLKPLHAALPASHVTWITRRESAQVLKPNRLIDEVVAFDADALLLLETQRFDVVINPDASITSSRLATLARAEDKRGFIVNGSGGLIPLNDEARRWYEMGLNDKLKKQNDRTYQSILLGICGLPITEHPILWEVTEEENRFALDFATRQGLGPEDRLKIGINTGAGGRWRWKKWTEEGYVQLIHTILEDYPDACILLYGGPEERERNAALASLAPRRLIDTGTNNSLRQFGALVDLCDVMVTGDTMALHLASALGKRIVALFGPTSAAEIELYGRGTKVAPWDMPCLGCYLNDCDVRPACMERIAPGLVMAALRNEIKALTG
jgi:ADP-heptose:LPS heptosyltransferase